MSASMHGARSAIASLAVLAVIFAPATHEQPLGAPRMHVDDVEARILAPTVREAVVSVNPKLSLLQLRATSEGAKSGSLPMDVPAAAGLLFLLLAWAARPRSVDRILALQAPLPRIPRGPPSLRTT